MMRARSIIRAERKEQRRRAVKISRGHMDPVHIPTIAELKKLAADARAKASSPVPPGRIDPRKPMRSPDRFLSQEDWSAIHTEQAERFEAQIAGLLEFPEPKEIA
jgi:hypothetical protein